MGSVIVVVCLFFCLLFCLFVFCFFFQAEDGIRDRLVTGVQTCALPICDDYGPITDWIPSRWDPLRAN